MAQESRTVEMFDVRGPEIVEILAEFDDATGRTILWVNIDGLCRLRVQYLHKLIIHGQAVKDAIKD